MFKTMHKTGDSKIKRRLRFILHSQRKPSFADAESGAFERKVLLKWTCADALQWLISLGLEEYLAAFRARRVDGKALSKCDRAAFTQLGVTRIAHRQKMEASLRRYMGSA
ncbi:hypothetical protein ANCCAN_28216 [Ancylostoma caninum]|uniref:SAM domain-containing protein n=1 Tax=Ancylostoma caninum TaxID=29170 RepID=A0A368F1T3_ANCCA|nr:hypothetical protein ANCCAN_28216 [Ancylostoma caninum]